MKSVIIDDEKKARESLLRMLQLICPDVEVLASAENVQEGVELIEMVKPELVFLDINMPDGTGFDLLNKIGPVNFKIIFITAHDEFAINAFKVNALDYLLKPVDPEELAKAVLKVRESLENNKEEKFKDQAKKVFLNSNETVEMVTVGDITYCEADRMYCVVHVLPNRKIMMTKTLKDLEEKLLPYGFFRAHKSYLVNIERVERFDKRNNLLKMVDGSKIPLSHRRKDELFELLKRIE